MQQRNLHYILSRAIIYFSTILAAIVSGAFFRSHFGVILNVLLPLLRLRKRRYCHRKNCWIYSCKKLRTAFSY